MGQFLENDVFFVEDANTNNVYAKVHKHWPSFFSVIGVSAAEYILEKDPFAAIALARSLVTTLKSEGDLW